MSEKISLREVVNGILDEIEDSDDVEIRFFVSGELLVRLVVEDGYDVSYVPVEGG